ncbi:hypothetical protein ES702_05232 [subsurface metagenome]
MKFEINHIVAVLTLFLFSTITQANTFCVLKVKNNLLELDRQVSEIERSQVSKSEDGLELLNSLRDHIEKYEDLVDPNLGALRKKLDELRGEVSYGSDLSMDLAFKEMLRFRGRWEDTITDLPTAKWHARWTEIKYKDKLVNGVHYKRRLLGGEKLTEVGKKKMDEFYKEELDVSLKIWLKKKKEHEHPEEGGEANELTVEINALERAVDLAKTNLRKL